SPAQQHPASARRPVWQSRCAGTGPRVRPDPGRTLRMNTETIQRQYDEVIASHYDRDPQAVIGPSLDRAARQIQQQFPDGEATPLRVLDVGIGTGLFLAKLRVLAGERIQPFGLDLSEKMIDIARSRIPDLAAEVGDAAHLDAHFPHHSFD